METESHDAPRVSDRRDVYRVVREDSIAHKHKRQKRYIVPLGRSGPRCKSTCARLIFFARCSHAHATNVHTRARTHLCSCTLRTCGRRTFMHAACSVLTARLNSRTHEMHAHHLHASTRMLHTNKLTHAGAEGSDSGGRCVLRAWWHSAGALPRTCAKILSRGRPIQPPPVGDADYQPQPSQTTRRLLVAPG